MAYHVNHKKPKPMKTRRSKAQHTAKLKRPPRGSGTFSATDVRRGFRVR